MQQRPRFWGDAESGVVVPKCSRASKGRHPRACAASAKLDPLCHPYPRLRSAAPGAILCRLCEAQASTRHFICDDLLASIACSRVPGIRSLCSGWTGCPICSADLQVAAKDLLSPALNGHSCSLTESFPRDGIQSPKRVTPDRRLMLMSTSYPARSVRLHFRFWTTAVPVAQVPIWRQKTSSLLCDRSQLSLQAVFVLLHRSEPADGQRECCVAR